MEQRLLREVHREEIDILAQLTHDEPEDRCIRGRQILRYELHKSVAKGGILKPYRMAHELPEQVLIVRWRDGGAFYSARTMPRRAHRISACAHKYGPKLSTARPHTIALTPRTGSDRATFAISDPGSAISRATNNMRDQLAG